MYCCIKPLLIFSWLHNCVEGGEESLVSQDCVGRTPLHYAALSGEPGNFLAILLHYAALVGEPGLCLAPLPSITRHFQVSHVCVGRTYSPTPRLIQVSQGCIWLNSPPLRGTFRRARVCQQWDYSSIAFLIKYALPSPRNSWHYCEPFCCSSPL